MKPLFCCVVLCFLMRQNVQCVSDEARNPIVLVPGFAGHHLETRYNKQNENPNCGKSEGPGGWVTLWLRRYFMVEQPICFNELLRLEFNPITGTTSNTRNVKVRAPGFGNTTTVEWLDDERNIVSYMATLTEELVNKYGYKRGKTLRAAPYDSRKAPNENTAFFMALKRLIEETYLLQNRKKVIIIGHDLGCLFTLYFLNRRTQQWKEKYIKSFVSISGQYGGYVRSFLLMTSGENFGVDIINSTLIRVAQMTLPASAYQLPYDSFWNDDEVLVTGPKRQYTVKDYKKFFNDIRYPNGFLLRKVTEPLTKELKPPGVEVHCVYGVGVDTIESLTFDDWHSPPQSTFGDGDGLVNIRSLEGCRRWIGKQRARVYTHSIQAADHNGILSNEKLFDYLRSVIQA